MRITLLLLIGISISLATALAATGIDSKKSDVAVKPATVAKHAASSNEKTTTKMSTVKPANAASPARSAKVLKLPADDPKNTNDKRGKRTLYDFENAGYLYPEIASRRAGYEPNDRDAYYPQSGYYNGQSAIAQFPNNYIGPQYYPQYLEAPEPIIEIIIKDSNDTLTEPEPEPQPIVTKKKKEKVHVFYVNYKKDQNNKLHLESPIASLNNDDNDDEEEEEEVVHYPVPATPAPPVKTTTLRTIIHPDSEKYHSNSGIHVTFGSEDKSQSGHQVEEHDAESIQSQVVALPVGGATAQAASFKSDAYNTRADFGASAPGQANQLFSGAFQQSQYQQQQAQHQRQQLPLQNSGNYFRPPAALVQQPSSSFYQKQTQAQAQYSQQQQQQAHQQQQQQLRPQFSASFNSVAAPPPPPPPPPSPQPLPTLQQLPQALTQFRKAFGAASSPQSHLFYNQNQQYQQQPSNQHQPFLNSFVQKTTPAPAKQPFFFPTAPPKNQDLPARQSSSSYQPVKFRPTLSPGLPHIKQVPIPAKLENTNYQSSQTQQQQQQNYQQQPVKHHQTYHSQQPFQYNRQPQFIQTPSFSIHSPQPTQTNGNSGSSSSGSYNSGNNGNSNYYKQQQQTHSHTQLLSQKLASSRYQPQQPQQQTQQFHQQSLQGSQQQSYQTQQKTQQSQKQTFQAQQSSSSPIAASLLADPIKSLHNYFGVQSSKETELLKSIPKYEQHITETIETPIGGVSNGQYNGFGSFGFQSQNQVLHDIPAPHLGPTPTPTHAQQSYQQQQQTHAGSTFASGNTALPTSGHFNTAVTSQASQAQALQQQQHFSNFVTTQNNHHSGYPSTTPAPPQYAQTTHGEKVMIVTPMPPNAYNQYHSSQYQQQAGASQILAGSSLLQAQQTAANYIQQPRQSAGSLISSTVTNTASASSPQFSVSNFHSDVFKELEKRRNEDNTPVSQFSFGSQVSSSNDKPYLPATQSSASSSLGSATAASSSTAQQSNVDSSKTAKASQTALQLPDEVPDDLRQQLLSSGILNNADISVLDYDKVGDVALENLPAEHLQHFYGAGGAAQISASKKVVTVVKPNGDKVSLSEKDIERVKQSNGLPQKQGVDVKVVRFDAENEKSISEKYIKSDATVVPPVDLAERQYNRYLPLKINGAQFPLPDHEELRGKKVVSVVVLAPVEAQQTRSASGAKSVNEKRSERETSAEDKEVKFIGGDLIKTLVKKPTKENFKRWLEKESRTDVEQQSVILLVAKSSDSTDQEIFMYDIATGVVNKLNGELSSAFVNVAEENASSEDLEHASTLDPSVLEAMMQKYRR